MKMVEGSHYRVINWLKWYKCWMNYDMKLLIRYCLIIRKLARVFYTYIKCVIIGALKIKVVIDLKEGGGSLIMIYIFKKETIKVTKFKRAWHCSDSHKSWWYFTVHGEKYSYFSLSAFLSIRHHRDSEVRQPKSGEAKTLMITCHWRCQHLFLSLMENEDPKTFGYKILPISSKSRLKRARRPKLSTAKPMK